MFDRIGNATGSFSVSFPGPYRNLTLSIASPVNQSDVMDVSDGLQFLVPLVTDVVFPCAFYLFSQYVDRCMSVLVDRCMMSEVTTIMPGAKSKPKLKSNPKSQPTLKPTASPFLQVNPSYQSPEDVLLRFVNDPFIGGGVIGELKWVFNQFPSGVKIKVIESGTGGGYMEGRGKKIIIALPVRFCKENYGPNLSKVGIASMTLHEFYHALLYFKGMPHALQTLVPDSYKAVNLHWGADLSLELTNLFEHALFSSRIRSFGLPPLGVDFSTPKFIKRFASAPILVMDEAISLKEFCIEMVKIVMDSIVNCKLPPEGATQEDTDRVMTRLEEDVRLVFTQISQGDSVRGKRFTKEFFELAHKWYSLSEGYSLDYLPTPKQMGEWIVTVANDFNAFVYRCGGHIFDEDPFIFRGVKDRELSMGIHSSYLKPAKDEL